MRKPVESQVSNRNLEPLVTSFAAFLVSFMHQEIWWGLREERQSDHLDQCWKSTGCHQQGPEGLTAQQLPGADKVCVQERKLNALVSRRES